MRLSNFVISVGDVSNNPNESTGGGGYAGTVTVTGDNWLGLMSAEGSTRTIDDGSSTRTIYFEYSSSTDDQFDVTGMGVSGDFRSKMVTAINGTNNGAVNVTAVDPGSGDAITMTHDSGGSISVSFGGESTSSTSLIEGGTTYISVSPSDATTPISTPQLKGSDFITGSIASSEISGKAFGKITLRQGKGSLGSLSSFNTIIDDDKISYSGGSFHITGSLSGASDPNSNESKSVIGDVLIICEGS